MKEGDKVGIWMDAERGPIVVSPHMDPVDMWNVLMWALGELERHRPVFIDDEA